MLRRGIMGWKLSKITDKNTFTSHGKDRKKKDHRSFRNVRTGVIQNSFLGPGFNENKRNLRAKKSSLSDVQYAPQQEFSKSVLFSNPNQIINLKAPGQFSSHRDNSERKDNDSFAENIQPFSTSPQRKGVRMTNRKQLKKLQRQNRKYNSNSSQFGSKLEAKYSELRRNNPEFSSAFQNQEVMAGENLPDQYNLENLHISKNPSLDLNESHANIFSEKSNKNLYSSGIKGSSVLMGDTAVFSPQSIILPAVNVNKK